MATTIIIKHGSESNRSTVTPVVGEVLVTTDQNKLFIGNNATAGGVALTASLADTASQANTASFYRVSNPTGQAFYGATVTSSVAGIVSSDRAEDAFNKVELILEKLAPAKPSALSSRTLTMANSYTALRETTGTSISTVFFGSSPIFSASGVFGDGDAGSLTASIDGTSVGSTAIAYPASNVGTYGALQITNNDDFWAGVPGKSGFWRQLLAQINATGQVTVGPHSASLSHSSTGTTPNFIYYIDDAVTPTTVVGTASGSGFTYISGVPSLVGGVSSSAITFTATASNTVGRFYNSTRIFSVSGTGITAANFTLPSSPVSASVQSSSKVVSVNAGVTGTTPNYTITAYNSRAVTATGTATSNFRIDSTVDTANRVTSYQNQFPSTSYGGSWDSSQDLSVSGQEELQMLNGQYQYPTGNYSTYTPTGPNYSSLPSVTFSTIRWVTFSLGSQTSVQNVTLTFATTAGFGSAALEPGGTPNSTFYLYVKVEGATGWVDGNASFPGSGSPSADGAAALDVANSNGTVKKVTFGATPRSGVIYVRVGFASGQAYKFGSISATYS